MTAVYTLLPTTATTTGQKFHYRYFSGSAQEEWMDGRMDERNGCCKISKKLWKSFPFPLTLQACSPDFPTSAKKTSKKCFSSAFSEIVINFPEKGIIDLVL